MNNGDYVPLDQEVIDQEVIDQEEKRTEAKNELRDASKNAGGNFDIIVFHDKRVIKALNVLGVFWCEVEGEILVSRHEVYDVLGMK